MPSSECGTCVDYSGNKNIKERRQNDLAEKCLIKLQNSNFFHEFQVIFDAFKRSGPSDIALDDIGLTNGKCNESIYVEPTVIPAATTAPSVPSK